MEIKWFMFCRYGCWYFDHCKWVASVIGRTLTGVHCAVVGSHVNVARTFSINMNSSAPPVTHDRMLQIWLEMYRWKSVRVLYLENYVIKIYPFFTLVTNSRTLRAKSEVSSTVREWLMYVSEQHPSWAVPLKQFYPINLIVTNTFETLCALNIILMNIIFELQVFQAAEHYKLYTYRYHVSFLKCLVQKFL